VLAYYRRMIALRKRTPALVHGSYRDITGDHAGLYAYVRGDAACVILNFSDHAQAFRVPSDLALGSVLIANLLAAPATDGRTIALEPWHAAIFTLRPQRNAS
jgi:oligo-1,6-glucosidase